MFILIGAMGLNREIGNKGKLPWKLPEDLAFFKNATLGKIVVMGSSTYESIGNTLPWRRNVIISSKVMNIIGVDVVSSVERFLYLYGGVDEDIYIIGGASIYKQFLPICDKLLITEIQSAFEADTFMPEFHSNIFELSEQSEILTAASGLQYKFTTYNKI